ncbi:MAG: hypothetical protein R3A48_21715 [Polyangiales bacterium]
MSPIETPRGVTVKWSEALGAEAYRVASPRRLESITVRPGRRGLAAAASAGVGGATGAAMLFEYGMSHTRGLVALAGVSLAVIAGVLLDRLAPRVMNRTEVRLVGDALECRQVPLGDTRPLRIPLREIARFEIERAVDPMATPPAVLHQVNARKVDGSVEPVIASVDDPDTAEWLLRLLSGLQGVG